MANDGSEDKKCELLDRGSMYSLSGAQLSKIKTGTKKIHPCTFRVPRVMEGKFIFRRADVNKHLQTTDLNLFVGENWGGTLILSQFSNFRQNFVDFTEYLTNSVPKNGF